MTYEEAAETAVKALIVAAGATATLRFDWLDDASGSTVEAAAFPVVAASAGVAYGNDQDARDPMTVPMSFVVATLKRDDQKRSTLKALYETVRNAIEKYTAADWTSVNPSGYAIDALFIEPGGEKGVSEDEPTEYNYVAFDAIVHMRSTA